MYLDMRPLCSVVLLLAHSQSDSYRPEAVDRDSVCPPANIAEARGTPCPSRNLAEQFRRVPQPPGVSDEPMATSLSVPHHLLAMLLAGLERRGPEPGPRQRRVEWRGGLVRRQRGSVSCAAGSSGGNAFGLVSGAAGPSDSGMLPSRARGAGVVPQRSRRLRAGRLPSIPTTGRH